MKYVLFSIITTILLSGLFAHSKDINLTCKSDSYGNLSCSSTNTNTYGRTVYPPEEPQEENFATKVIFTILGGIAVTVFVVYLGNDCYPTTSRRGC